MSKSNIVITSTSPQGKTLQKTLTDINPAATNSQLATFGNMLNQLTDNVYGNTTKITKTNCDGEAGKTVPTLTLTRDGQPVTEFVTTVSTTEDVHIGNLTYDGDGRVSLAPPPEFQMWFDNPNESVRNIYGNSNDSNVTAGTYTVTISTEETATYTAASYTFTLIIEEG